MDKGRFAIEQHLLTGKPISELARVYGVDRSWLYRRLARYRREGPAGLELRSKRPAHSPTRLADLFEDEIVAVRKELADAGYDAGAETIKVHLARRHAKVPSAATIYRVLKARGFVNPEPRKRPRSSWRRFCADLPNECWQADVTHVEGADGVVYEVLNIIDDHSRLCVASRAFVHTRSTDVVRALHRSAAELGYPETFLSDIQAVCALGSTVRPAGDGRLSGDRCPLRIAADRSERLSTPCLLGVSRAGATPGKERPIRYSVTGLGRIPVGECPARPPR